MKRSVITLFLSVAAVGAGAQNTANKHWLPYVGGVPVPGVAGSSTQAICEAANIARPIAATTIYECRFVQTVRPPPPPPAPAPAPAPAPVPPPPPSGTGSIAVSWVAPTSNADGTPLTDLGGYRVQWGQTPGSYSASASVGAGVSSYVIPSLSSGTWYVVVRALDTAGNESLPSVERSATLP